MAALIPLTVPEELLAQLAARALQHQHSLEQEILACLEGSFAEAAPDGDRLARIRARRDALPPAYDTSEDIEQAIAAGRL